MGGNPVAARLAGINLNRYKMGIYLLSGLVCGLAAVISTGRTNSGIPTTTQTDLNFQAITAAVLGGTALAGGKGTIVGTLLGVVIIGTLNNGMIILGVPVFYQMLGRGFLLIFAVLLQEWQMRRR
jgi:ribose transport system permease protein/L-arabinose transport system permease protein